jgi:hypothetical protein
MGMRRKALFRIPIFFGLALTATLLFATPPASHAAGDAGAAPEAAPASPASDPASADARAAAWDVSAYVDRLVDQGRRRRLSDQPYWHTLLHYKRSITGLRSLVDDPRFFASPRGKHDPAAEMEATIRAFFEPADASAKHPVCRFVARYYWIKDQLNLDPALLPVNECEHFTRLIGDMKPESTTLVFPTAHMNSPASMFGHTLLIYETKSRSKLLAYAVNYAAITTDTFGPLFAVKGIFGSYKGYFSVLPYYAKLQEYTDIGHRDMWEYPLNFTREETIRSIMHAYELDGIYSDYYFFDENCSYVLLFLLEVGRPSINLTDQMPPWVIPLDTIRVVENAGLVAGAVYRPSKTTKIRHIASLVSGPSRSLALDLARGKAEPERVRAAGVSNEERIRTYDLAIEYLQYLYTKKELGRDAYTERFLKLLTARSALGIPEGERYEIEPSARPEEGHLSNRARVAVGVKKERFFQELGWRAAYHTLTDYGKGYPEGSHIAFVDTTLRYYFTDSQLKLQKLDLVDIISLAPVDALFQPVSWKVKAGLAQRVMDDGQDHLIFQLTPGGGIAYRLGRLGISYLMAETDVTVGEDLRDKYALGIGGSLGILASITDRWTASLAVRGLYYGVGDRHSLIDVTLTQSYALTTNLAISVDVSRNRTRDFYQTEGKVSLNIFF